jgi:hypothetical protein
MKSIDLSKEMAWVTFLDDDFETNWFPLLSGSGQQLEWNDDTRVGSFAFAKFLHGDHKFGVAPTSQMILGNSVKDNL